MLVLTYSVPGHVSNRKAMYRQAIGTAGLSVLGTISLAPCRIGMQGHWDQASVPWSNETKCIVVSFDSLYPVSEYKAVARPATTETHLGDIPSPKCVGRTEKSP